MAHFLIIAAYCLMLGAYGYLLYRKIDERYYTFTNLLAAAASLGYAQIFSLSHYHLGLSTDYFANNNLIFWLEVWFVFLFLVAVAAVWKFKLLSSGEAFWRIPLGTALAEEIMFRGVLFGFLFAYYGHWVAIIFSSIMFGIWHLLPNPMTNWADQNLAQYFVKSWQMRSLPMALTLLVTAIGGVVFAALRSFSLIAPWLAHITTNFTGRMIEGSQSITYNRTQV